MQRNKPELRDIPVDRLKRGEYQPRRHFDQEALEELAQSIRSTGLLQPIVVRPLSNSEYEIIAGERRWRAAQIAGLDKISCLVSEYTDAQAAEAATIENIIRVNLNPIEVAQAYQRLIDDFRYYHDEIAAAVGKSRSKITNALRLLKLDLQVQALLIEGELSEGHGKIIAGLPKSKQYELARRCVNHEWSVRRVEQEVKKQQQEEKEDSGPYSDPNMRHLEQKLTDHVGNPVTLECENRGGGFLKIRFNNIDELEGHFQRLGFNPDIS